MIELHKKYKMTLNLFISLLMAVLYTACSSNGPTNPKFEMEEIDGNVQIGYGLAIGDVDGDGKDDILLADKKQFVWYRNPDWQRFVMIDNLTQSDNVCIAARDINGDGQVEVAVGAQWNPGETNDFGKSGSVHYLLRPEDPTKLWDQVELYHEPTIHRMRWVKTDEDYQLVVLPLHGIGNKGGEGNAVNLLTFSMSNENERNWSYSKLDLGLHITHNMDVVVEDGKENLYVGGKEGLKILTNYNGSWIASSSLTISDNGFGELRKGRDVLTGIQPFHGSELVIYDDQKRRTVLTDSLKQGHALAIIDLLSQGQDQIIVGWRNKNDLDQLGIKIFVAQDEQWSSWQSYWIDQNEMACEDLKIADLNGDGKKDIIAAGRSTKNLRVYWNKG